jgi:hypothetical protein
MSRESSLHVYLVETMIAEVKRRHSDLYSLTIYADIPAAGRDRPGFIGGYIPDLFAIDVPETHRIIGEAKTPLDCETPRSTLQIKAFLTHLSQFKNGLFYLCVPWSYRVRADTLLAGMVADVGANSVKISTIGSA